MHHQSDLELEETYRRQPARAIESREVCARMVLEIHRCGKMRLLPKASEIPAPTPRGGIRAGFASSVLGIRPRRGWFERAIYPFTSMRLACGRSGAGKVTSKTPSRKLADTLSGLAP